MLPLVKVIKSELEVVLLPIVGVTDAEADTLVGIPRAYSLTAASGSSSARATPDASTESVLTRMQILTA